MSSLMEEGGASTTTCICPSESLQEIIPIDVKIYENCSLQNSAKIPPSENEPSVVAENQKKYSAFRVIDFESADQVTQKKTQVERKRKNRDGSCLNSAQSKVETQGKDKKHRVSRCNLKDTEEKKLKARKKKVPEVPACGYIHVRARRGQATDSHSLAERVRREKISERMKLLQGLVPGCDKITGKTHMLDEIINYVNSLQNQVEFLSMKLASLNTLFYNFGVDLDGFMAKPENSSNLVSQLASMQQSSPTIPTQSTSFVSSATTFATTNNYPTLDQSISILLQEHSPNAVYQDNENLLCDVITNQRQRVLDQSEFHKLSYFQ